MIIPTDCNQIYLAMIAEGVHQRTSWNKERHQERYYLTHIWVRKGTSVQRLGFGDQETGLSSHLGSAAHQL